MASTIAAPCMQTQGPRGVAATRGVASASPVVPFRTSVSSIGFRGVCLGGCAAPIRAGRRSVAVYARGFGKNLPQKKPKARDPEKPGFDDEGYPLLPESAPANTYNMIVKKPGALGGGWKGLGSLKVPPGENAGENINIAKAALIQRKPQVLREIARLYPKIETEDPKLLELAVQKEKDPYADPVDLTLSPPTGMPVVPALVAYLEKGKNYGIPGL